MKYDDIIHRCFRCGYCKLTEDYTDFNCPPYRKFRFESYSPGGRMWLIRAWLNGEVQTSKRFQEVLYSCTMCANCVEHCIFSFSDDLVNIFTAAREEMVADGNLPPTVRDYLKSLHTYGNPYKAPAEERGSWANGLSLDIYDDHDYLLYVGCVGAYDERGQQITRAVADLLVKAGVSFGILGSEEICDGNEARSLGESGLFEMLARQNMALFEDRSVTRIITVDPHAYNAFHNYYRKLGANFEVFHYTQILADKMDALPLSRRTRETTITYHDPCYLGRHNGEYDAPRRILNACPGTTLVEMESHKSSALCCGGGGGNFFSDILGGGEESAARIRVRQARDAGARIIAVACPQCAKMLEDAIKVEELQDHLEVADIAEIVSKVL